jgi:ribosomal protein L32
MASKRRLRRRSCERKVGHLTQDQAVIAKKSMIRLGKSQAATLYPYKCANCGKYHLGHLPKRVMEAV